MQQLSLKPLPLHWRSLSHSELPTLAEPRMEPELALGQSTTRCPVSADFDHTTSRQGSRIGPVRKSGRGSIVSFVIGHWDFRVTKILSRRGREPPHPDAKNDANDHGHPAQSHRDDVSPDRDRGVSNQSENVKNRDKCEDK